jgi:hypothetical protein
MNQQMADEIDSLLAEIKLDSSLKKDIVVDTLCDYIDADSVSTEYKNKITENVLKLFDTKNTYEIQESIFNFLVSASVEGILRERIFDLILNYMSRPEPEFLQYAIDILMYADLPTDKKTDFKKCIQQCLSLEDSILQKQMMETLDYYKKNHPLLFDEYTK